MKRKNSKSNLYSPYTSLLRPLAEWLEKEKFRRPGIANGMRLASAYNGLRYGRHDCWRRWLYENHLDALLKENCPVVRPNVEMPDGWAIDTSMALPHLDRVLAEADQIIAERGGHREQDGRRRRRGFFHNVWKWDDALDYRSILDFATSSDILSTACRHLKTIPSFSHFMPPGIRLVESNAAFDDRPDTPHDSQLFHMDYYNRPNLYVIVLLRDTTVEMGPFTFLPRAASEKARQALGYWNRGVPYNLSDERFYAAVDRRDVIEFTYPRGSVLYIESSACFHFGSRNAVQPRFQLMLAYNGLCRTDFSEVGQEIRAYPTRESDSLLRKLVCDKLIPPPRHFTAPVTRSPRVESFVA